jgi:hypothetical protein
VLAVATYATAFVAYWLVRSRKEDLSRRSTHDRKEQGPEGKGKEITTKAKEEKVGFGKPLESKGDGLRVFRWQGKKDKVSNEIAA